VLENQKNLVNQIEQYLQTHMTSSGNHSGDVNSLVGRSENNTKNYAEQLKQQITEYQFDEAIITIQCIATLMISFQPWVK